MNIAGEAHTEPVVIRLQLPAPVFVAEERHLDADRWELRL